ncbi:MAG: sigma-54 interaction domain-containing protein [Fibrobacterota bacterium]
MDLPENIKTSEILDNVIGGIFITDSDGIIKYFNRGAENITGFSSSEISGKPCTVLGFSSCSGCADIKNECSVRKIKEKRNIKCTFRKKDGSTATILRNVKCLKTEDGATAGTIESLTDISELICARRELEKYKNAGNAKNGYAGLVGKSHAMQEVYDLIEEVSNTQSTVLILGESGTGKEVAADAIHNNSPRKNGPFVKVNCSALSESLLESELFGHVKGAFTGATSDKAGRFEIADHGTLFLDEIGDISMLIQLKLLRVLQEKEYEPVGSSRTRKTDVRVIAATHRNLKYLVNEGKFRQDLYYRLNIIQINIPPLRKRREDIPLLLTHFIEKFRKITGKEIAGVNEEAMALLLDYEWPGNIRELENAVEHAFIRSKTKEIEPFSLPQDLRKASYFRIHQPSSQFESYSPPPSITREILEEGLRKTVNKTELAKKLGVSRTTLWKKLKQFGITA